MKRVSTLIIAAGIFSAIFTSCATMEMSSIERYVPEYKTSAGFIDLENYEIVGKLTAESTVIARDKVIYSERNGIRPLAISIPKDDTLCYGFTEPKSGILTTEETAVSNAMYKIIKQTDALNVDAITCVTKAIEITPVYNNRGRRGFFKKSFVSARVTALGLKLKADYPVYNYQGAGDKDKFLHENKTKSSSKVSRRNSKNGELVDVIANEFEREKN